MATATAEKKKTTKKEVKKTTSEPKKKTVSKTTPKTSKTQKDVKKTTKTASTKKQPTLIQEENSYGRTIIAAILIALIFLSGYLVVRFKGNENGDANYKPTADEIAFKEDYESLNFNTAISQMMIFINAVYKEEVFPREYAKNFIKLLNPLCPHITEEIWHEVFKEENTLAYEIWPSYDSTKLVEDTYTMIVQVNGKVRGKMEVSTSTTDEEMKALAKEIENVKNFIEGHEIIKEVVVPKKLVNIVVK